MLLKLLKTPFSAPFAGAHWLATEIHDAAERELNDPARLRAELNALEKALDAGEMDEETFEVLEDELITRLQAANARGR